MAQAGTILQHLRKLLHAETTSGVSDAQLLQRFVTHREEAAFATLMGRHGPAVLRLCRRVLNNTHDAEDAFQATFLVLARMAKSIRKGEALGSWLYGVAYRIAMKASRAKGRRREREGQMRRVPRADESADLALRDLQAILDEEINRLPAKYRGPFVLCCLECKSREEAAQELGWKLGTLSSRLAHARRLLQQRLTRRGVTLSTALGAMALATEETFAVAETLAGATLQAAVQFSSRRSAVAASSEAVRLANGMLRTLVVSRVQRFAMLLMALLLLPAAIGLAAQPYLTPDIEPAPPAVDAAPQVIEAVPGTHADTRLDQYGDALPDGVVRRFGTLRLRNAGAVAFTPDGKHLVTGEQGPRSAAVFWDRQTGKETRRLPAEARIAHLLFSPNGAVLVAMQSTVFSNPAWDAQSGKVLFRFKGEYGTFTTDGRKLLTVYTGKEGRTVGAWDVASGKQVGEWAMPEKASAICCSPDGQTVAYSVGETLVLYDLATRSERRRLADTRLRRGSGTGNEFAFSGDGKRVAASSLGGLRLWNVATGQEEFAWDLLVSSTACFSDDGKHLAWTGYDRRSAQFPWLHAIGQGEPRRLGLPVNNLRSEVAFARDGATLAVISDAGAVELRDVATGRDALPLDANAGRIFGLQLSPNGRCLLTYDNFRVLQWDRASGKLLRRFPEDGPVRDDRPFSVWDVRLDADGELRHGHANNTYGHWQDLGPAALTKLQKLGLKDGQALAFADFQGTMQDVLESRDGRYVAVHLSAQQPGVIDRMARQHFRVWDTRSRLPLDHVCPPADLAQKYAADGQFLGAFSPDNRLLATTSRRGTIHLWDLATGRERLTLHGHLDCSIRSLLFTPDARFLFSGGDDSQVLQWDLTGRTIDGVWRTVRHDPKKHLDLWNRLGDTDAAVAHRAAWELAADPDGTVAFLQARLKPILPPNDKTTAELVARLDADSFAARQEAEAALRTMGEAAVPALRTALADGRSLEQARRIERLLQTSALPALAGDALRSFRAVEVLERIATPDARRLLGTLAQGLAGTSLTQAAAEANERLAAR